MSNTSFLYIKQRFPLQLFIPLALFIILYALGTVSLVITFKKQLICLFPLILFQLLAFRIFDDIVSREEDRNKPNRIYTQDASVTSISVLLVVVILITLGYAFFIGTNTLICVVLVYAAGLSPYFFRSFFGRIRFIIPLLKYPLLAISICYFLHFEITTQDIVASVALFLGFVLYEMVEDTSIGASQKMIRIGFWVTLLPFYFLIDTPRDFIIITLMSSVFFIVCVLKNVQYLHFLILILVLILRVIIYEL